MSSKHIIVVVPTIKGVIVNGLTNYKKLGFLAKLAARDK